LEQKKKGRPRNPKIKIADLLDYLDSLPNDNHMKLTPDKLIIIKRYIEELQYLEKILGQVKADIDKQGEIEYFVQGKQKLRRVNPSMELYYSSLRAYRGLVNKIEEIIKGVEIDWQ